MVHKSGMSIVEWNHLLAIEKKWCKHVIPITAYASAVHAYSVFTTFFKFSIPFDCLICLELSAMLTFLTCAISKDIFYFA